VLGADGSGLASDVIEAIDWAIEHRAEYNLRVINLSIGAPVMQPYGDDPLCEAVERAYRAGLVVITAAGNYGRTVAGKNVYAGVASPGNSPYAITVGAIDTHDTATRADDTVAPYSSKGPTRFDLLLKPDVSAPGTRIESAQSSTGVLSTMYPERHVAGIGPNASMQLSGTSMAAAIVSGAAALVLQTRNSLTPSETRAVLQLTSTFLPAAGLLGAGAGMIDVSAAVELADDVRASSYLGRTDVAGLLTGRMTVKGLAALLRANDAPAGHGAGHGAASTQSIRPVVMFWNSRSGASLFPGAVAGETIIWGTSTSDNVIWGTSVSNTIIWGTSAGDTIIWGTSAGDTIIWGTSDTIIWGTSAGDTIIWGTSASDTIIWGTSDTIIWGTSVGEPGLWEPAY
jgi:serine protease AprX